MLEPAQQQVIIDLETGDVTNDEEPTVEQTHQCFEEGCDPLIGILNETASKKACCPLKSYLDLTPQSEEFKAALTSFGRRMVVVGDHYQVDIHGNLLQKQSSVSLRRPFSNKRIVSFFRDSFRRPSKAFKDEDRVEWLFSECSICSASCRFVRRPPCCRKSICQICWSSYLKTGLSYDGIKPSSYDLHCYGCSKLVPYRQALVATQSSQLTLLRHDGSDLLAHCPVCLNEISQKKSFALVKSSNKKYIPVVCDRCGHSFCARCGAEPHSKISCYEVTHADAGLSLWMREQHPMHSDFQNCRFCPNCSIPIYHGGGCPYLKCVCGLEFCFACGEARQRWNGWHRQKIMRIVPFFTCPRLWKSQAKRVAAQTLFSLFFITILLPLIIAFLPLIVIISLLVLAFFARLPSNRVAPAVVV